MNQDLVRNNIEELLSTCDRYINTIGEFTKNHPKAADASEKAVAEIEDFRAKWNDVLEKIDTEGMDEEGEYSYTELSYSGSYAFVILSGIVKNYRFALERMQIAKEFEQYWL